MTDNDKSAEIQEQVLTALAKKTPLRIVGGNSKAFYGLPVKGEKLVIAEHRGILHYEPSELVITARAGTPLAEIENLLATQNQRLAFEPPYFANNATLGGTIACGLSGSRRPYNGAVRDAVLGVRLLNGKAEILKFGGQVMKNVAGFDVSRLQVGALGTLGVLLDISLRVMPRPETEITLCFSMSENKALDKMRQWSRFNLPFSGMCFDAEKFYLRLSGATEALAKAKQQLGGEQLTISEADNFWVMVREQQHPFFQTDLALWRLSLAPATPNLNLNGETFIDWGGALRWLKTDEPMETIFTTLQNLNGHAYRFRSKAGSLFQPLSTELAKLQRNIKHAFDPYGIFNPGKLYPEW